MLVCPHAKAIILLTPIDIEYFYDHLDCNALNFVLENGYFSIHRSIVIDAEEDPIFALPYFMLASPD